MDDEVKVRELAAVLVLASEGRLSEALAKLDQQQFRGALEPAALLIRAQLLEELDLEQCWRTYTMGLERFSDHAAIPLRAGVLAYKRGDLAQAKQLLMRSWHLCPAPETAYYLGVINRAQGDEEQALEYFVQTVAMEGKGGYWRKQAEEQLQPK